MSASGRERKSLPGPQTDLGNRCHERRDSGSETMSAPGALRTRARGVRVQFSRRRAASSRVIPRRPPSSREVPRNLLFLLKKRRHISSRPGNLVFAMETTLMENSYPPHPHRPHQVPDRIIRLATVIEWVGMQKSWIYREMAAGRFVRSFKLGRTTVWDAAAVQAWIRSRLDPAGFQ